MRRAGGQLRDVAASGTGAARMPAGSLCALASGAHLRAARYSPSARAPRHGATQRGIPELPGCSWAYAFPQRLLGDDRWLLINCVKKKRKKPRQQVTRLFPRGSPARRWERFGRTGRPGEEVVKWRDALPAVHTCAGVSGPAASRGSPACPPLPAAGVKSCLGGWGTRTDPVGGSQEHDGLSNLLLAHLLSDRDR